MLHDGFGHLCPYLATILDEILSDEDHSPELVGGWFPGKIRAHRFYRNKINRHMKRCALCIGSKQYKSKSDLKYLDILTRKWKECFCKDCKPNGDINIEPVKRRLFKDYGWKPCTCDDCKGGTTDTYKKEYV